MCLLLFLKSSNDFSQGRPSRSPVWIPDQTLPLSYSLCFQVLFLLLLRLLTPLQAAPVAIVRFTAIFESIDAAAQNTSLALAIRHENLVVEVTYELAHGRHLLRCDRFPPEHRPAFC